MLLAAVAGITSDRLYPLRLQHEIAAGLRAYESVVLVNVPAKTEFRMEKSKSQGEWLNIIKTGACNSCHGLGTPGMRTISPELGQFQSSTEAWTRRLMSGGAQMFMIRDITRLDTPRAIAMFAEYIEWRAQHPADDLMTALLNAESRTAS